MLHYRISEARSYREDTKDDGDNTDISRMRGDLASRVLIFTQKDSPCKLKWHYANDNSRVQITTHIQTNRIY